MNFLRKICWSVMAVFVLAACGTPAAPTIYKTVSDATLKPGSAIPAPKGDVILTIEGKIGQANANGKLQFDLATLESLGTVQYEVDDPNLKKKVVYTGVLMSQVLKAANIASDSTTLTLKALDDYSTDMKVADANKYPILIATKADGAYMTVDKYGPLSTIIPYGYFPELDHDTYDALWVWSLADITVK